MSTRRLLTVVLLVSTLGRCIGSARGADAGQPRFIAPTNQQELDGRVAELRRHYGPFLRSLPPPLPARERTALPKEWKFTFEAKLAPKKEGVPPAPAWFGADFDDSPWETTTVPEWRYRVREGDGALEPKTIDKYLAEATTADTICRATLGWSLRYQGQTLREGRQALDVPALGVVTGETVDLSAIVAKHPAFDLLLTVADAGGQLLSRYQRTVRAVPIELQQ